MTLPNTFNFMCKNYSTIYTATLNLNGEYFVIVSGDATNSGIHHTREHVLKNVREGWWTLCRNVSPEAAITIQDINSFCEDTNSSMFFNPDGKFEIYYNDNKPAITSNLVELKKLMNAVRILYKAQFENAS